MVALFFRGGLSGLGVPLGLGTCVVSSFTFLNLCMKRTSDSTEHREYRSPPSNNAPFAMIVDREGWSADNMSSSQVFEMVASRVWKSDWVRLRWRLRLRD